MDRNLKAQILRSLTRAKDWISRRPEFIDNPKMRGIYVILATLEASIMFGTIEEFANVCSAFCQEQSTDQPSRN